MKAGSFATRRQLDQKAKEERSEKEREEARHKERREALEPRKQEARESEESMQYWFESCEELGLGRCSCANELAMFHAASSSTFDACHAI